MSVARRSGTLAAQVLATVRGCGECGVRLCAAVRPVVRAARGSAGAARAVRGLCLLCVAPVSLLASTDQLYDTCSYDAIYAALLPYAEAGDAEVLWRLARACYRRGKTAEGAERAAHYREGLAFARSALEKDDTIFSVHKWVAILVNEVAQLEGSKERILQSFVMKEHMQRATELNPEDGTCWHILGMWHYNIATIPWYQRKAAAVLFATPPESSVEEALEVFLHAEEVQPNFYSQNLVMIGRCQLSLGQPSLARPYLERARDYTREHMTQDDLEAKEAALELLKGL